MKTQIQTINPINTPVYKEAQETKRRWITIEDVTNILEEMVEHFFVKVDGIVTSYWRILIVISFFYFAAHTVAYMLR